MLNQYGNMIDYHLHTLFCNHAVGGMNRYIQSAIDLGLREICFLDHLTIQKTDPGLSMTPEEVPYYFNAVQVLKQKYRDKISIKAGLEVDFNPVFTDFFQDIIGTFAFDVIAASLHFPDGLDIVSHRSAWRHGEKDVDDVYELYFDHLKKMLDYRYFDVICHIDLIKKFGQKPSRSFEKEFDEILSIIKDKNLTVEVNTSGYDHPVGDIYPSLDILKKCHEQGIRITLGSDAHHPANVGKHFERVVPTLLSIGYRKLTSFTKRKWGEIPIPPN
jgi:histidinol-phosphatase (PHP family)